MSDSLDKKTVGKIDVIERNDLSNDLVSTLQDLPDVSFDEEKVHLSESDFSNPLEAMSYLKKQLNLLRQKSREDNEVAVKEVSDILDDLSVFYLEPEVYDRNGNGLEAPSYKYNKKELNDLVEGLRNHTGDLSFLMKDIIENWKKGPLQKYSGWGDYGIRFERFYGKSQEDMTFDELTNALKKEAKSPSGLGRTPYNEVEVIYWTIKNVIEKYLATENKLDE